MEWPAFATLYCERQVCEPHELRKRLRAQHEQYANAGWFMLECQMLDSSRLGELTILPYGPNNTFKAVPQHPVSPRGLASDMATVKAVITLPEFWSPATAE